MNVLICSTADHSRTVVEIDGKRHADSSRVLMFPIPRLADAYSRVKAQVTVATLPTGTDFN